MSDIAPAEDAMLAAEYALGVLDAAARRAITRRATIDPGLRCELAHWEQMLAPLAALVPPVDPPQDLWPRLQHAIARDAATPAALRRWQSATAVALALAACLAIVAVLPRPPAPIAIAALAPLHGPAPGFVARLLPDGSLRIAAIAAAAVPPDRDLELWALPAGVTRPVALGVLPAQGAALPASTLTAPGGKLLVSLEPKGGSPTGQPTGPVLYGGTITRL